MFLPYNDEIYLAGFADCQPSETIEGKQLPYIATACIFAVDNEQRSFDVPVKKYDGYSLKQKARAADELAKYIKGLSEDGIALLGTASSHRQTTVAEFGLRLASELPNAEVVEHYGGYRLNFGDDFISLADAAALLFYTFVARFGILRAGLRFGEGEKRFLMLMDSFPSEKLEPGQKSRLTKFVEYAIANTETGKGITAEDAKLGITTNYGHLNKWRKSNAHPPMKGKSHPLLKLPDWAAACANAVTFPTEFASQFSREVDARKTAEAMERLWSAFKSHNIWSFGEEVLDHIVISNSELDIPEQAKEWLRAKAGAI
ncbi:hypothetical protein [Sphingorhabdus sp. Alg239-R122]|uniref:hypothetical protein n=1 Tax=Sphingorhabdus sp. Alg239-R122 TaxID=2305989 RepID=UPI0013D8E5D5|nr:hypothetical protein [Sphingorhabdus sp. Alg239-R122]